MVVSGSESPIVVVLRFVLPCVLARPRAPVFPNSCPLHSGSMEPGYFRGDLLFLWLDPNVPIEVGDVTVFKLDSREIPVVHRVIEVHDR